MPGLHVDGMPGLHADEMEGNELEQHSDSDALHEDESTSGGGMPNQTTERNLDVSLHILQEWEEVIDLPYTGKGNGGVSNLQILDALPPRIIPEYTVGLMILNKQSRWNKGQGAMVTAMIDTGATSSWVTPKLLQLLGLEFAPSKARVRVGDGRVVRSLGKGQLFLQYGSQQIRSWFEVIDIPKFHMILGRDLINTLQLFPDTPSISSRVCPPKPIQVAAPGSGIPE